MKEVWGGRGGDKASESGRHITSVALTSVTFKDFLSVSCVWDSQGSIQANITHRMNNEGSGRQISKERKNGDPEGERKSVFIPPLCNLLNQDQFGLAALFSSQQHPCGC